MRTAPPPDPDLSATFGGHWQLHALGASAFCDTWEARQGKQKLFVKNAGAAGAAMLRAEADGLRALAATGCIRVPSLAALADQAGGGVLLALEWLELAPPDDGFGARFGAALARLHAQPPQPASFGWYCDNFIGATPQRNGPRQPAGRAGWTAFFTQARLGAMRDRLPPANRELRDTVAAVIEFLPSLFADGHDPQPALVHGDLWQGNWGMLADGTPVVWDPAVSCSDPEAELAMMELFGSPPPDFRAAYEQAGGRWPPPQRLRAYQLYHLLNHVVLFGGSYEQQALRVARAVSG